MADADAVRARAEARRAKLLAKSEDRLKAIEKRELTTKEGGGAETDAAAAEQPVNSPVASEAKQEETFPSIPQERLEPISRHVGVAEARADSGAAATASAIVADGLSLPKSEPVACPPLPLAPKDPNDAPAKLFTGDLPPLLRPSGGGGPISGDDAVQDERPSTSSRPLRPRTQLELAQSVLKESALLRTAVALVLGILLGGFLLRPQPVVLFLALQLSAVAAGAQLLASAPAAVYGPAASLAGWLTGSASSTAAAAEEPPGEPAGASSAASAADPQPPWLKLGLSVLEVAAPELKAKVPLLLGGLRVAGAVADDLAVFLVALILTRCIGAGSVLPGAAAAAAG